jgi:hypothetical protein
VCERLEVGLRQVERHGDSAHELVAGSGRRRVEGHHGLAEARQVGGPGVGAPVGRLRPGRERLLEIAGLALVQGLRGDAAIATRIALLARRGGLLRGERQREEGARAREQRVEHGLRHAMVAQVEEAIAFQRRAQRGRRRRPAGGHVAREAREVDHRNARARDRSHFRAHRLLLLSFHQPAMLPIVPCAPGGRRLPSRHHAQRGGGQPVAGQGKMAKVSKMAIRST